MAPLLAEENKNLRMDIARLSLKVEDMQKQADALRRQQHKRATSSDTVASHAPTEEPGKNRLKLQKRCTLIILTTVGNITYTTGTT